MKKLLLLAGMVSISSADFIGGELSMGMFQIEPVGYISDSGDTVDFQKDLNWEKSENVFGSLSFEHPIPIIPNVKVSYSNILNEGTGNISKDFTFGSKTFTLSDEVYSKLDLKMYDGTLYYEILDNWISVDVGATARYMDLNFNIESTLSSTEKNIQTVVPMAYGKFQFELPGTDLSVIGEGNYVSYDGSIMYDAYTGVRYLALAGFGVEGGYKKFYSDINIDDTQIYSDFEGVYAKIVLDF